MTPDIGDSGQYLHGVYRQMGYKHLHGNTICGEMRKRKRVTSWKVSGAVLHRISKVGYSVLNSDSAPWQPRDTLSPCCQVFPLTCDMLCFLQEIAYSNLFSLVHQPVYSRGPPTSISSLLLRFRFDLRKHYQTRHVWLLRKHGLWEIENVSFNIWGGGEVSSKGCQILPKLALA